MIDQGDSNNLSKYHSHHAGVRGLPSVHPGRYVGTYPTLKCPEFATTHGVALLPWESSLEFDNLDLAAWDPEVERMVSQPLKVAYLDGDRTRRYTPDLLEERREGRPRLIEVKYVKHAVAPEFQRFVTLVTQACDELGYDFEVRTEHVIRREPRLSNVKYILRYGWEPVPDDVERAFKRHVAEWPGVLIREAVDRLGGTADVHRQVYALLASHAVRYDIERPLEAIQLFPNPNK